MNLRDTYNKIAKDWHRDHQKDTWWIEGTEKFLSLLEKGSEILDVGCGEGTKSKYILDKGYKVAGIDFSESMIQIAKEEVLSADFEVLDIYNLPQIEKTFDGVFAQAVLLHIPKNRIGEVIQKLKDKVAREGFLYIAVKEIRERQSAEEVKKENDYGYEYERFFSYFTLPEMENYLEKAGIEVVWKSVTTSGRVNWIQVIARKGE